MKPNPESGLKKPRLTLLLATAFGLGYFPIAPATFGSLAGVAVGMLPHWAPGLAMWVSIGRVPVDPFVLFEALLVVPLGLLGVWIAGSAARYLGQKDPSSVVVDEVSGQQLTLLLGGFWHASSSPSRVLWDHHPLGLTGLAAANWKYLLLGFVLFRVFDIWKPFPARQAEALPGGWGIMADDWIAAIYAALGLWLARGIGL